MSSGPKRPRTASMDKNLDHVNKKQMCFCPGVNGKACTKGVHCGAVSFANMRTSDFRKHPDTNVKMCVACYCALMKQRRVQNAQAVKLSRKKHQRHATVLLCSLY